MTMKITKTGRGSEKNDESLLFEWLNHEAPEKITLRYNTELNTNRFAGSLQTNQINGIYLEPISFSGEFFGEYLSPNDSNRLEYVNAKERSDQLARLQGRIIKFWYEGVKQLVIISKYEINILNYNHIEYMIEMQPHDIQIPIKPSEVKQYLRNSFVQSQEKAEVPYEVGTSQTISQYENKQPLYRTDDLIKKDIALNNNLISELKKDTDQRTKFNNIFNSRSATAQELKDVAINKKIIKDNTDLIQNAEKQNQYDDAVLNPKIKQLQLDKKRPIESMNKIQGLTQ